MTSHSLGKNRNSSSDPSGYKLQQESSGDGASSSEGSGSESTERGNDSRVNFPGNEVSAMPSNSANGAVLPAERERKDTEIVDERKPTVKRGIERFSKKGCRDEGLDNYDQSSGKAKGQIQATGVGKISAKNSGEFKDTNEHVEKSQNTKRQNESGAFAQKAVKKAAEENNGSVASILLGEKRTEQEQKESEASTLLTWKRTGKKKGKSEASALVADKGREEEQNGSEASALAVKKRTGEEESGIDASALKTEKSFESVFAKTGHNAVDEGASSPFNGRSCETTFYDNVSLTMGDKDVSGFKFVTNSIAAFDSSSCESSSSYDVSLTMEAIDVSGIKVVECSSSRFKEMVDKLAPCSSSNLSISKSMKLSENKDTEICGLVLEELITQVCEMIENENSRMDKCKIASGSCCQACADTSKSSDLSRGKVCGSHENSGNHETSSSPKLRATDVEGRNRSKETEESDSAENIVLTDANSSKDLSWRADLIKTPIVCDTFSVRNLDSPSPEKVVEKSFACSGTEILEPERNSESTNLNATCSAVDEDGTPVAASETRLTERDVSDNPNLSAGVENGMPVARPEIRGTQKTAAEDVEGGNSVTDSVHFTKYDSEIHITNGHEGPALPGDTGAPVDTAREEMEDGFPRDRWREPPLPSHPDWEKEDEEEEGDEEEDLWFEEEGDDINQVSDCAKLERFLIGNLRLLWFWHCYALLLAKKYRTTFSTNRDLLACVLPRLLRVLISLLDWPRML